MGPDRRPRYLSLLILCLSFLAGLAWSGTAEAQLTLQWTDNSDNENGFKIERKTGAGGTFQQVATTGANATSFPDTGLGSGTTYCYRIRAFNTAGDSPYTNEACGSTPQAFNLSVVRAGGGSGGVTSSPAGINCGTTCSASFTSGTQVTLTAAAAAGSTFARLERGRVLRHRHLHPHPQRGHLGDRHVQPPDPHADRGPGRRW